MRRRAFLLALGGASAGSAAFPGLGAGAGPPGEGRENGRGGPDRGGAVENLETGTTYEEVGAAIAAASPGDTLAAALGATFPEDVVVDVEDLTLEAAAVVRPRYEPGAAVGARSVSGTDAPSIDDDLDVLHLEADGTAAPTVEGGLEVLRLEARGNAEPTIEGDVGRAFVDVRGNAAPTIRGDVDQLVLRSGGNASPTVEGDVDRLVADVRGNAAPVVEGEVQARPPGGPDGPPAIEGDVVVEADGVTVAGFDVAAETVGVDVRAPDPETVQLAGNRITTDATPADDPTPEAGVGVRVPAPDSTAALSIGGEVGRNVLEDNAVGIAVVDGDGAVADVDVRPLLVGNGFVDNEVEALPRLRDPSAASGPEIDPGPPTEVLAGERAPGQTVTAELPDLALDEEGAITATELSIQLEEAAPVEVTVDPERTVDDAALVAGYEPLSDGAVEVATSLDNDEIAAVRFMLSVDRDAIDDPERFSLHRGVDGDFEPLRTTLVTETPERYRFAALSPGFSLFQATEFAVGGIGGPGRELHGELVLPEDDPVDATFLRLESTAEVDDLALESRRDDVQVDDLRLDLGDLPARSLPTTVFDVVEVTNEGDEPATVRTTAGLRRATVLSLPADRTIHDVARAHGIDLAEFQRRLELDLSESWGIVAAQTDVLTDPVELAPGQTTTLAVSVGENEPDEQFWASVGLATLAHEGEEAPFLGSEGGIENGEYWRRECTNLEDAPVLHHLEHSSDGSAEWLPDWVDDDKTHLRVPAYLDVNWKGAGADPDQKVSVEIETNDGPEGSLIGFYYTEDTQFREGWVLEHYEPIFDATDFLDGRAEREEVHLLFESDNDCDVDEVSDHVYDHVGDVTMTVTFSGDDNRLAEHAGADEVSVGDDYYTIGESLVDESQEVVSEAMQTWAEYTVDAVAPGPLQTYRAARRAMGTTTRMDLLTLVDGALENVTSAADRRRPWEVLEDGAVEAFRWAFGGDDGVEEPEVHRHLEVAAGGDLEMALSGPSVYVSDDPAPDCVPADVRTFSVQGQLTGGPVILMGLDSEWGAGHDDHGTPENHAEMVQNGILDNVTNGGEGILVLGGADGEVETYWREDVGENVGEPVDFAPTPADVREADFEGYAMLGVATDDIYSLGGRGVTDEENEALVDRSGDIAAFVNEGGGLLGKTQDSLSAPWSYVDPFGEFEINTEANFVDVAVEPPGEELGLEQDVMSGWCCWHETFAAYPDYFDVLVTNTASGDPGQGEAAALGGDAVVIETAVDLEVTGPSNVEVGEPTEYEVALENAADEAGGDVRLEVAITRPGGIEAGDVELDGGSLELEDGALVGSLTDEPVAFPPALDRTTLHELTAEDTGAFEVELEVVVDETDEAVVRLPFGIRSVSEERGVCGT